MKNLFTQKPTRKASQLFDESEVREITENYDLAAALRNIASPAGVRSTFEQEVSEEFNRRAKRNSPRGPLTVPDFVLVSALRTDPGPISTAAAAALIQQDVMADMWISALAARTVLGEAGMKTIGGLNGDVAIPKGSTVQANWFDNETAVSSKTQPTFDNVTATPHTIGAYIDITRRLIMQSALPLQRIIADLLAGAIARGIESAAFNGTGEDGQPKGIGLVTGIQTATVSATPTKAELVAMWQALFAENVVGKSCAYIGNATIKGALCSALDIHQVQDEEDATKAIGAVTTGKYLCEDDKVEGYDFIMSNLCGDNTLWFADWSELVLCSWSGVDLLLDRYSLATSGGVRLVALQDVDIICRHPKAFLKATVTESASGTSADEGNDNGNDEGNDNGNDNGNE